MQRLAGLTLAVAITGPSLTRPGSEPPQADIALEITITGGPHAGTYKLPEANTICLHVKAQKRFSAAYKDVEATDPKLVSGAGINIFNPDDAGAKEGQVNITFGDPKDKKAPTYDLFIPRDSKGPLTMTKKGKVVDLAFEGQTKQGVKLKMTARCTDVTEL